MKNTFFKIKNRTTKEIARFGDIRHTGQIVFLAIVFLVFWSGVRAVQSNYRLQRQVASLSQQNQLSKLQNSNMSLQNDYYNSKQYLELSARQNFGLAVPGENELLVPQNVALSYTKNIPAPQTSVTKVVYQSKYQINFESWVNFFLHRNAAQ